MAREIRLGHPTPSNAELLLRVDRLERQVELLTERLQLVLDHLEIPAVTSDAVTSG